MINFNHTYLTGWELTNHPDQHRGWDPEELDEDCEKQQKFLVEFDNLQNFTQVC